MSKVKSTGAGARLVWRKLSPAKWEDVWQERLGWLGQRLVIFVLAGMKTLRMEAHQLTRAEADLLTKEFGGTVRTARALTKRDLEPEPRPPLRVRGKLVVVGTEKERAAAAKDGVPCVLIPASLAFGTGEHATTATCLRILADVAASLRGREWDALDIGTGSGILALAARHFGARKVEAGDFDATAVRLAKENAAANGVRGVVVKRFDVLKWKPARRWPVVLANVYGPILIEAAPQIASAVEHGGALILSGILREQADDVIAAFKKQRCRFERITRRGKWVTCLARVTL
jgi:ribosomal protein L11 methyltransferase